MIKRLLAFFSALFAPAMPAAERSSGDAFWQQVYDVRAKFYEEKFGPMPRDILKMLSMTGVWPGGGLFAIPAQKLGNGLIVYTTFGLTNPDMPTTVTASNVETQTDGQQRVTSTKLTLSKKTIVREANGRPGYGYELLVLAKDKADWPVGILQWVANAEILHDVDLLSRVEKYSGLTVEDVHLDDVTVNLLIAKAGAPLPETMALPNGKAGLLVATVITDEEMAWSMTHGRDALLTKLHEGGVHQVSTLKRDSVVK